MCHIAVLSKIFKNKLLRPGFIYNQHHNQEVFCFICKSTYNVIFLCFWVCYVVKIFITISHFCLVYPFIFTFVNRNFISVLQTCFLLFFVLFIRITENKGKSK